MAIRKNNHVLSKDITLDDDENSSINNKIEFELASWHYRMAKIGVITNVLTGAFVVAILFGHVNPIILIGWYAALVLINIANIIWAVYHESHITDPTQLKIWNNGLHLLMALMCITWGSMGILFITTDLKYQLFVFAFLLVVLVGFAVPSVTDFRMAAINIAFLIIPPVLFRIYLGLYYQITTGVDPNLNLAFGLSLFVMGSFLSALCFFGSRLVHKFFRLSFVNVALSKKLENMNKHLEQRVQERTFELGKSLEKVTYQATHDLLTELPNRQLMFDYMKAAIKKVKENGKMFAVVFFSLNEIEKINDGLGHLISDQVIKEIAQRLKDFAEKTAVLNLQATRYTITLSRRDEFVILIEPVRNLDEIETKTQVLFSVLDEPIYTNQQSLKLTGSIGVSVYPIHGSDIKTLLMNADAARINKRGGNSLNIYQTENNADFDKQLSLESDLHAAVKRNEFILQYQPFVNLATNSICGMEALVRWLHPTLGFIPPMDFIQLAESNGMIIPLGEWVLRTACMQTKFWHDQGYTFLKVSVNLSARQLRQKNIAEIIIAILKETGLQPKNLELELTESEAFKQDVVPILHRLSEIGVGLSIDDFGTGFSGLTNLKLLNVSKIKIDKSFVQDIETDKNTRTIVSNIITLAKELEMVTVAEGVENKKQLKILFDSGCDLIQGYYFSRPVNADVFTDLLRTKRSLSPSDLS